MADVSHELGALRFVVDSSLSSKVAMFNNQVQQHQQGQLLNPFSGADGRSSPKPTFSKDEYGKPLAGSLTEMRGQKANMHVFREMLELCQIIDSEGYSVSDEPTMRVIPFGELFNIYNYISDKVVGILLRARKYKYVQFEGEMLFQRRDDDVPVFLLRPVAEIRAEVNSKIDEIKRASSPVPPQATSLLLDKGAHQQKLQEAGLSPNGVVGGRRIVKARSASPALPRPNSRSGSKAGTPTPANSMPGSKSATPTPEDMSSKPITVPSPVEGKADASIAPKVENDASTANTQMTNKAAAGVPSNESSTGGTALSSEATPAPANVSGQPAVQSGRVNGKEDSKAFDSACSITINDLPEIVVQSTATPSSGEECTQGITESQNPTKDAVTTSEPKNST